MKRAVVFISLLLLGTMLGARAASRSAGPADSPAFDPSAYATIVFVDQVNGNDFSGEGTRAKPWATLSHALEHAVPPAASTARAAILVAAGNYAQATFALKSRVDIYGSFAPFAPSSTPQAVTKHPRSIVSHPTILDGEQLHQIAIATGDTRIDGLCLINARHSGKGGALVIDGVSPTITNCVFSNNRTLAPRSWNPPALHETANDGGAIFCCNGAAPRIENCLFIDNATECGRGGAIANDHGARPVIVGCVFANNRAGLDDPMRSSDGGAVTWFDWSAGEFTNNIVVGNVALASNDAGGIWIAMWSAPVVRGNVIASNYGDDDAGGLFVGGQEHRYGVPLDTYPAAKDFNVVIEKNILVGNSNKSKNSGAMRITMESRVQFVGNLIYANTGGMYFQRSEAVVRDNIVLQDWQFVEDKPTLGPSVFENNLLVGPSGGVEARVTFKNNRVDAAALEKLRSKNTNIGNSVITASVTSLFADDGLIGDIKDMRYDPATFTTRITLGAPLSKGDYTNRTVRFGDSLKGGGQWRVIKQASGDEIVVWGHMAPSTKPPKHFEIDRTYTLKN